MSDLTPSIPAADLLVRRLREHGVRDIFGYPGGHLTPIYDAIYREPAIRHYLARHEQAAAFMADGYARASGRPGVCLAVCGPGVFNTATPLATAFTDSTPVLVVSGQIQRAGRGVRTGYYHENDQLRVCETLTKQRVRVDEPERVVAGVDEAWRALTTGRPGPVLLEVPLDVLCAKVPRNETVPLPSPSVPLRPSGNDLDALARLVSGWKRPLLFAGGGTVSANAESLLVQLAERLGAPVVHTSNGKCAVPGDHPLARGMPWRRATSDLSNMQELFSPLFAEGDGLLIVGCRLTQLATGSWTLRLPPSVAQIDIDAAEIGRHYPVQCGVHADAAETLCELLERLPKAPRQPWAAPPPPREPWRLPGVDLLAALRRVLPSDTILSVDVTRLAYILMAEYPLTKPRTWLHPSGSVAMGFGIPAALGAKAAFPQRQVVAVVGDGCFMMSALELASSRQEGLPIVVVLVNDSTLTLIKATQQRKFAERYIAVDLQHPDFRLLAQAFAVGYWRADGDTAFEASLRAALKSEQTAIIEVRPSDA
jgi:thiamine pyrophosphate-dependent acetolactate synthase large subunit-like protein